MAPSSTQSSRVATLRVFPPNRSARSWPRALARISRNTRSVAREGQTGEESKLAQDALNLFIGSRFDAVSAEVIEPTVEEPPTNGVVDSIEKPATPVSASPPKRSAPSEESELSDLVDSPKPKKKRKATTVEDNDAAYAARLQEEENRMARPTRGGATRKRAPVKSAGKKKKKSAAKVKDDDDSSKESGSEEPKERKGGFHVCCGQSIV